MVLLGWNNLKIYWHVLKNVHVKSVICSEKPKTTGAILHSNPVKVFLTVQRKSDKHV